MALKMLNAESLRRKMARLPVAVKDKAKASLKESAIDINRLQKILINDRTGDLGRSVGYTFGKFVAANANVRGVSSLSTDNELSVTLHAGDEKAFYAAMVEFGTINADPHPFFLPAFRAKKTAAKRRLRKALKDGIKEAASG